MFLTRGSEPAAAVVLPVVAQWPQCTEYVLPDADGDDNDLFEEHKVQAANAVRRIKLRAE